MYHGELEAHDGCGCQSEGDVVGQRVELLAYGRRYVEQSGAHAVEEVEGCAYDNPQECDVYIACEGMECSNTSCNEIAGCQCVGDNFLDGL